MQKSRYTYVNPDLTKTGKIRDHIFNTHFLTHFLTRNFALKKLCVKMQKNVLKNSKKIRVKNAKQYVKKLKKNFVLKMQKMC